MNLEIFFVLWLRFDMRDWLFICSIFFRLQTLLFTILLFCISLFSYPTISPLFSSSCIFDFSSYYFSLDCNISVYFLLSSFYYSTSHDSIYSLSYIIVLLICLLSNYFDFLSSDELRKLICLCYFYYEIGYCLFWIRLLLLVLKILFIAIFLLWFWKIWLFCCIPVGICSTLLLSWWNE